MTSPADARLTPVHSEADLTAHWAALMGEGGFGRRSLWLAFFDDDGLPIPTLIPIDDIPLSPDRFLAGNVARIVAVLPELGAASAAVLLSRPGPAGKTAGDRRWARAVFEALRDEIRLWPVHLATADRVDIFSPDDLIGA